MPKFVRDANSSLKLLAFQLSNVRELETIYIRLCIDDCWKFEQWLLFLLEQVFSLSYTTVTHTGILIQWKNCFAQVLVEPNLLAPWYVVQMWSNQTGWFKRLGFLTRCVVNSYSLLAKSGGASQNVYISIFRLSSGNWEAQHGLTLDSEGFVMHQT